MTFKGVINPLNRFGLDKTTSGPLAKASFEQPDRVFCKSAIYNEFDNMNGVSSNIMFGQRFLGGTNNFSLLLDEEEMGISSDDIEDIL